jgi:hypothetical protein
MHEQEAAEAGYYFDVYSSTTAQEHDHGRLLLCEVHLGRTWRYVWYRWSMLLQKNRKLYCPQFFDL